MASNLEVIYATVNISGTWSENAMAGAIDTVSLISLYLDVCITSNVFRGVVSLRLLRLFTLFRLERKHKFFSPILTVIANKQTLGFSQAGKCVSPDM